MKIKVPARSAEVCDYCRGEGFLQECRVCGGQYCLTCRAIIGGCVVDPHICRECKANPKVMAVVEKYAAELGAVVKRRRAALKRCKSKAASAK